MTKYKEGNLVHLAEEKLDTPIYRIYALDKFKKLVTNGKQRGF